MVLPFCPEASETRSQVIASLRQRELQEIRDTCNRAIHQLVAQNLKDLATRK